MAIVVGDCRAKLRRAITIIVDRPEIATNELRVDNGELVVAFVIISDSPIFLLMARRRLR